MEKNILLLLSFLLLLSCKGSESDEGNNAITYISIYSEGGNEKLLGKSFTFKVKDNLNNDVTAKSQIFVNQQEISGNSFIPTEKGVYSVKANYRNLPLNPISVQSIVTDGISFKHRILYEDFTGTWCGYCTVASARRDNLALQTNDFVFLGIHGPDGTTDPWSNATSTEIENLKNVTEWPSMYINRTKLWPYDLNYTDMSVPLSQLNAFSKIGIKINSTLNNNILNTEAKIFFTENFTGLKLAAFIAEDELIFNQKNYISTLYGGSSTIYNYNHHNVLRGKLTSSVSGDAIPNSQTVTSNEYSKSFQYTIPSGFNANHLKIIILVLNGNGTVLNVREEKIVNNSNYEFL